MATEIKTAWLQWIGCDSYPKIKDYVDEALTLGISKKITNAGMAKALVGEGNIIFLAHDEAVHNPCPDCIDEATCPDCRVTIEHITTCEDKIDFYEDKVEEAKKAGNSKGEKRANHAVKAHTKELENLHDKIKNCKICDGGTKKVNISTGGYIEFANGKKMDRVSYQYYSRKPEVWRKLIIANGAPFDDGVTCLTCGGVGYIPEAKIFGFFIPSDIEYILVGDEEETFKKEIEDKKIKTVITTKLETKRGCGFRKPGSFYAVTKTDSSSDSVKETLAKLIAKGLIKAENAEVSGNFCNFVEPIKVEGIKRFRGLKKWNLDPEVEEAFDMAIEALEE